jgi:hypothetical protein
MFFTGKKTRRGVPTPSDMFLQVLELHPEILQQILSTVLNVIMFEDCRNQWSMSRPLLGLILLNEEVQYLNSHKQFVSYVLRGLYVLNLKEKEKLAVIFHANMS